MKTLLTISSNIPLSDHPSTPAIVMQDNGDWEIAFDGDVGYIKDTSPTFLGAVQVIEIFNELRLLNDYDEIDDDGVRAHLFIELSVDTGTPEEPVVGFWNDGSSTVMDLETAQNLLVEDADFYNFITFADLLPEVRTFVHYNQDTFNEDAFAESVSYDDEDTDND